MDSKNLYSRQNDQYRLDPKKIKKLQENFRPSSIYSRSVINELFQELDAQELKKHKAENNREKLPPRRNAQITLREDAYALLDKAKIKDEEYAEFLYQLHGQYAKYKKIEVKADEFAKVLPQIESEWPDAGKRLRVILDKWMDMEEKFAEAKRRAEDSESFYNEAVKKLADAEKKPSMAQLDLKKLRDNKIALETEHYKDKEELSKWNFRVSHYRNLDFNDLKDADLNNNNLQLCAAAFAKTYAGVHEHITHALKQVMQTKKQQARSQKPEGVIKAEIDNDEQQFANVFKIAPGKWEPEFRCDEKKFLASRIVAKVINQRVQQRFERKKDAAFHGVAFYILNTLILHDECNDNKSTAVGNAFLGTGSLYYRGISKMLSYMSERAQQKCLSIFRDFAVDTPELFARIAINKKTGEKYIDGKKVGKDIQNWKDRFNWEDDPAKRPALKSVKSGYDRKQPPQARVASQNIADFMSKDAVKLKAYDREGTPGRYVSSLKIADYLSKDPEKRKAYINQRVGKWTPSTKKMINVIEADRLLKVYNKNVAPFKNIEREHTQHTSQLAAPPRDKNVFKAYDEIEKLRTKFELEELVKPHDIVDESSRLNTADIIHDKFHDKRDFLFSTYLKNARERQLGERKYPSHPEARSESVAYIDSIHRNRDAALSQIRCDSGFYLMPKLPKDLVADKYNDSYIYATDTQRLYYTRDHKTEELRIANREQFKKSLIEIMGNEEFKYLTNAQVKTLMPVSPLCVLTRLPLDIVNGKWNDTYIYSSEAAKLFYIRNGRSEEVNITDMALFKKSMNEIMSDNVIKYLTNSEVNKLITSNGGHSKRAFKVYPEGYPRAHQIVMDPQKIAKAKAYAKKAAEAPVGPVPRVPKP